MERRAIAIRGTVQGVGFRPFVYGLANQLDLRGFVRNGTGGVQIEVEGEGESLDQFLSQLTNKPPALARIEEVSWQRLAAQGERIFRIERSNSDGGGLVVMSPDVATCEACLAELFDPADRHYRYPFLNCTNCGPRLTVVVAAPYDRARTTMAGFAMCPACRAEYENPTDRRFHAQPTACAACGPRLIAGDAAGRPIPVDDPLAWLIAELRQGKIAAMKGLGGYHLVCDARNERAVAELRRRKHRDEKPFAVMVRDVAVAEALCEISPAERELLCSSRRPIVLLRKRAAWASFPQEMGSSFTTPCRVRRYSDDPDSIAPKNPGRRSTSEPGVGGHKSFETSSSIAESVAPGHPFLGVMLPYTPLHHLLLADIGVPLVMTSGNRSDEPIAYIEPQAFERLAGIADVFLSHNRPIHVRCDDSVTRIMDGEESLIRRSRGYAPRPIPLPMKCPQPILATGGQLKATFALGRENQAIVSHHTGDLDQFEAYQAYEKDIALYERLFEVQPKWIAHDLHPDYASTRYALRRGEIEGVQLSAVQHHHAHMASCMAEHGLDETVIGVTFDGTGFGTDGAVWGGEFLIGDFLQFHRAAHLRYVGMAGGEQAIRQPWRMAVAHLIDSAIECAPLKDRLPAVTLKTVERMIERRFNTPLTSSAGRLFDAIAALAGVRDHVSYEGQAAMQLEWLATNVEPDESYPFSMDESPASSDESSLVIDTRPLIRAVAVDVRKGTSAAIIARRFHSALVELIHSVCRKIRSRTGIETVVFSGGVFMNALLSTEANHRLTEDGFRVHRHCLVPPNDGGLSLGQLAVAARRAAVYHGEHRETETTERKT
jgi:hydrogenase maturation protein HypF